MRSVLFACLALAMLGASGAPSNRSATFSGTIRRIAALAPQNFAALRGLHVDRFHDATYARP